MHRTPAALAIVIALFFATGCGSDDEPEKAGGSDQAETTEQEQSAAPKQKKKASARSKLVDCIEGDGLDISHKGDDAEKATEYTVGPEDPKRAKAQIVIHSNRDDAQRSATRKGEDEGINAVAFGRAEFIRRQATDTEAGRIVNCMSAAYGG